MQKLSGKLKNVPRDVKSLLVPCSTSPELNREETLSVQSKVLTDNNLEGVQPECTQGLKASYVYVLSKEGKPLMPCSPAKAKHLLRGCKAVVIKRIPFIIQLLFECENKTQNISLGIDSGYENVGFSATSENNEFISGILKVDSRTSKRLAERRKNRQRRRSRLWHRKPRFLNRRKKEGCLTPSVERRYQTHLNLIKKLKNILPISQTIIEVANFDIQKIMNPNISGIEYQQGDLYEYQNMRSYLMSREKGKCQLCKKPFEKRQPSHIHHCKQRSESGSNRPENLAILHKKCHDRLHEKGIKLSAPKDYKPNAFMSIIHKRFWKDVPDLKVTYGYETFIKRNEINLEKTHNNDAFVVAGGSSQERVRISNIEQKHRHNRAIQLNRKGFKPSIRTSVYKIQPKDLVQISGKMFYAVGVMSKGSYVKLKDFPKTVSTKKIEKIYNFGSFSWNFGK